MWILEGKGTRGGSQLHLHTRGACRPGRPDSGGCGAGTQRSWKDFSLSQWRGLTGWGLECEPPAKELA